MKMISDEVLNMISGGVLPDGWQEEINEWIKMYSNFDERELGRIGYTKDADGMIMMLRSTYREEESNVFPADIDIICDYIRNNYK